MKRAFLLTAAAGLLLCVASAQETTNSASVSGRVIDPSGATVPEAQVTARQTDTNINRTATTDKEGRFRLPYLKVGPYEITVEKQGFAPAARRLTLTVGSAFELPVSLAIATEQTEVVVTDEPTVLEAARSQPGLRQQQRILFRGRFQLQRPAPFLHQPERTSQPHLPAFRRRQTAGFD